MARSSMTVGAVEARMVLSSPPIALGTSTDDPEERAPTVAAAALELDEQDVDRIERIDRGRERRLIDPEDAPW